MDKENRVLKKAQEIILAKPEGELTLNCRRMFNLLLYRAMKAGRTGAGQNGIHKVQVSEMMEYASGQSWDGLHRALVVLASATLVLDYVDEDGVRNTSRVHYLSYHMTHSKEGWVHFAFDPLLLEFIYDPKIYALMSMSDLESFRTKAGQRLYELLSLRSHRQFGREWEVGLDEFRDYMGIASGDYRRFDNFRERVIQPAVDEVNELAPFRVSVDYRRAGRGGNVVSLRFTPMLKGLSILAGRDASLAMGKRAGKRAGKAPKALQEGSGDLFGYSDGEGAGGVTDEALEAARRLMGGEDPMPMVTNWLEGMRGRTVLRPDRSFLSWLEASMASKQGGELEGLEAEDVDALLESWLDGDGK